LEREDLPNLVYLSDQAAADLARACRISNAESELYALHLALSNYIADKRRKPLQPGEKQMCLWATGRVCEQVYECDKGPPDLGDLKNCPPRDMGPPAVLPPPRERYVSCLPGCGGPPRVPDRNTFYLDPDDLKMLEEVVQLSGAPSRQQAIHQAVRHYEEIWLRWRQEPDFYQRSSNLPRTRKPDSPCPFAEPGRY